MWDTLEEAMTAHPYYWKDQTEYDEESNHSEDILAHAAYVDRFGNFVISAHDRGTVETEMAEMEIAEYDGPFLPWERMQNV